MSGNATLRGSEDKFVFCQVNEKTELVKSEYFRWFYDQIPSLVKKFKKKILPWFSKSYFLLKRREIRFLKFLEHLVFKNTLKKSAKSPWAAEALANFFLGPNSSAKTLKKKKKKKKKN